ncbi:MFS transporter [Aspergillus luchuensis IFO 4308]|nr:MFS transporter [Aspergillus luchuensis IFO 4308]
MSLVIARSFAVKNHPDEEASGYPTSDIEKKTVISVTQESTAASTDEVLSGSHKKKWSWFHRSRTPDPNAIATQPSVYDDPDLVEEYKPRPDWEGIHRFDPAARWTWAEENKIVRKLDLRIIIWACIMITALELDKSNIQQANADNFLTDIRLSRDGGFTPTVILYLSYFYKHHELSIRLGYWYAASSLADMLAGILAYGILHLGGHGGQAGWRWLFLIEGLLTLALGLLAIVLLPPSATQTAHWARGKKGWFTAREETIMVNRLLREDPTTVSQYFTLQLKDYGFSTFNTILLSLPCSVIGIITRILLTYGGEIFGSLAWMGVVAQLWCLPFLIYMNVVDLSEANKWIVWSVLTLFLGFPNAHALQAGWVSRNSNSVRTRAIAAAIYNMSVQLSAIIASNIYRDWDAPRYVVGNRVLLSIVSVNMAIYLATKVYYMLRNRQRDQKWNAMTEDQRVDYVATTRDEGNRRLDFRFAH